MSLSFVKVGGFSYFLFSLSNAFWDKMRQFIKTEMQMLLKGFRGEAVGGVRWTMNDDGWGEEIGSNAIEYEQGDHISEGNTPDKVIVIENRNHA